MTKLLPWILIPLYYLTCLFLSFWFWNEVAVGPWWYCPCAITLGAADLAGCCVALAWITGGFDML